MDKKVKNKSELMTNKKFRLYSVLAGCFAGIINGLFGGGGGMIVVPMLTNLLRREENRAHATAILIILPLSIVSGLFYASFGNLDLSVGVPVTIGVTVGGALGALLLSKLTSKWIGVIFSVVMAAAGIKLLLF
ncbi:MAG: sulfite exporter TauE/SafE family protein [Clostridia bacterium]|nr:sulfite exporter TauE/SafE family protein [Clostridia bacterium]